MKIITDTTTREAVCYCVENFSKAEVQGMMAAVKEAIIRPTRLNLGICWHANQALDPTDSDVYELLIVLYGSANPLGDSGLGRTWTPERIQLAEETVAFFKKVLDEAYD